MLSKKQRAIYEANLRLEIENPRINAGEEDEFCLEGYIYCLPRTIGLAILVALTGGLFLVALVLRPSLRIRLGYRRCSLDQAQFLILQARVSIVLLVWVPISNSFPPPFRINTGANLSNVST